jgi:hypothetical protein
VWACVLPQQSDDLGPILADGSIQGLQREGGLEDGESHGGTLIFCSYAESLDEEVIEVRREK